MSADPVVTAPLLCNKCGTPALLESTIPFRESSFRNWPSLQIPTEEQCHQARTSIDVTARDLAIVEGDIDRLQAALDYVLQKRRSLQETLAWDRSVISAGRKLPTEILRKIFLECVSTASPWLSPKAPSIVLGQVCQRWRAVACHQPELWTTIAAPELPAGKDSATDATKVCLLASLWLQRSGQDFVHIDLTTESDDLSYPLLKTVFAHVARWKSAKLVLSKRMIYVISRRRTLFPRLESLEIVAIYPRSADIMDVWQAFCGTPALSKITGPLHSPDFSVSFTPPLFPWKRLHEVNLAVNGLGEILNTLKHCAGVRVVRFGWSLSARLPRIDTVLRHDSLETLGLGRFFDCHPGKTGDAVCDLLDRLATPSLQRLELHHIHESFDVVRLRSFLERSRCTIVALELCDMRVDDETVLDVLHSLPALERLYLDDLWYSGKELLESLTVSAAHPVVAPRLSFLSVRKLPLYEVPNLVAMIDSRCRRRAIGGVPKVSDSMDRDSECSSGEAHSADLQKVELLGSFTGGMSEDCERWRKKGLDVSTFLT